MQLGAAAAPAIHGQAKHGSSYKSGGSAAELHATPCCTVHGWYPSSQHGDLSKDLVGSGCSFKSELQQHGSTALEAVRARHKLGRLRA